MPCLPQNLFKFLYACEKSSSIEYDGFAIGLSEQPRLMGVLPYKHQLTNYHMRPTKYFKIESRIAWDTAFSPELALD